jgi:hypothetical protein
MASNTQQRATAEDSAFSFSRTLDTVPFTELSFTAVHQKRGGQKGKDAEKVDSVASQWVIRLDPPGGHIAAPTEMRQLHRTIGWDGDLAQRTGDPHSG